MKVAVAVGVIAALIGGGVQAQSCAAADQAAQIFVLAPGHQVARFGDDICRLSGEIAQVLRGDLRSGATVRAEFFCAIDRPSAPGGPVYHATDGIEAADRIELHVTADGRIAYGGYGLVARFEDGLDAPVPYRPDCG